MLKYKQDTAKARIQEQKETKKQIEILVTIERERDKEKSNGMVTAASKMVTVFKIQNGESDRMRVNGVKNGNCLSPSQRAHINREGGHNHRQ